MKSHKYRIECVSLDEKKLKGGLTLEFKNMREASEWAEEKLGTYNEILSVTLVEE